MEITVNSKFNYGPWRLLVPAFLVCALIFSLWHTTVQASSDVCFATADDGVAVFSSADATAVQDAVDAAVAGATVKVAGDCVGTQSRQGNNQTVYISKTLSLVGGYDTADWSAPISAESRSVLDANDGGRVLYIATGGEVALNQLVIQNGQTSNISGGGIYAVGTSSQQMTLTLRQVTVRNNATLGFFGKGGGIYMTGGSLDFWGVAIVGNSSAETGGGLYVNPPASNIVIVNTVIYDNSARDLGGGLAVGGVFDLVNSTVSSNTAARAGGLYATRDVFLTNSAIVSNTTTITRSGVWINSNMHARNSILANNRYSSGVLENCTGVAVTSSGNNITDGACLGLSAGAGDIMDTDPMLRPMNTTDALLPYHYPYPGSPVIDAGETPACTANLNHYAINPHFTQGQDMLFDSLGNIRYDGDGDNMVQCDIGPVEYSGEGVCNGNAANPLAAVEELGNDVVIQVSNINQFSVGLWDAPYNGQVGNTYTAFGSYNHAGVMGDGETYFYQIESITECRSVSSEPVWFGKVSFELTSGS